MPLHIGNSGYTGNNSMIHTLKQESTLLAPPVGGVIMSSSRIPVHSNEGESAGGALSSQRKVETHSVEDARSNGAFTMDGANNATMKTEGHLHHKLYQTVKNSAKNTKNLWKIKFDESEETEEDIKNMTEEE